MIKLTRSISVSSFEAAATVAVGRKRPEFLAIAQLASDLNRPIDADDVRNELLGPLSPVLGKRIIERCVSLGLLDDKNDGKAELSEAGRLALDHGEVLVPEEGMWRFYVVDDPLVSAALIHVKRLEIESVRNERNAAKNELMNGTSRQQAECPPSLLSACRGKLPRMSVQDGYLFQLVELAEKGAAGPKDGMHLELEWNEQDEQPVVRLTGHLPAESKPIDANIELLEVINEFDYISLWAELVSYAEKIEFDELIRWNNNAGKSVAPIPFSTLDETARCAFRRDIRVPEISFQNIGSFDATLLTDVELVPGSESDAQEWLNWLEWNGINDYVTPVLLEQKSFELRSKFPYHKPRAQSPQELLEKALTEGGERSRYLLASFDLGLWRK